MLTNSIMMTLAVLFIAAAALPVVLGNVIVDARRKGAKHRQH